MITLIIVYFFGLTSYISCRISIHYYGEKGILIKYGYKSDFLLPVVQNIKKMTKELLEKADLQSHIGDRKKKIGIKPNLVSPSEASWGCDYASGGGFGNY